MIKVNLYTLKHYIICIDTERAKSNGPDRRPRTPTAPPETEQRQDRLAARRLGLGTETGTSVTPRETKYNLLTILLKIV